LGIIPEMGMIVRIESMIWVVPIMKNEFPNWDK